MTLKQKIYNKYSTTYLVYLNNFQKQQKKQKKFFFLIFQIYQKLFSNIYYNFQFFIKVKIYNIIKFYYIYYFFLFLKFLLFLIIKIKIKKIITIIKKKKKNLKMQQQAPIYERAQEAAKFIQSKTDLKPTLAYILGSGLGDYADTFDNSVIISYEDIPYFKKSTVKGHKGNLVIGNKNGKCIVAMQGRFHFYEGHSMETVVFPIYVFKLLGIQTVLVTNAAGGVNSNLKPGSLMIINDHINNMGTNPLIGAHDERWGSERFPDLSNLYNKELRGVISTTMKSLDIEVHEGVYMGFTGPTYETPAEVRMAGKVGGDAVGMSTVPEAIVAHSMGMKVGGISCICNMAAGISPVPLNHKEVMEVANEVKERFKNLIDKLTPQL